MQAALIPRVQNAEGSIGTVTITILLLLGVYMDHSLISTSKTSIYSVYKCEQNRSAKPSACGFLPGLLRPAHGRGDQLTVEAAVLRHPLVGGR